MTKFDYLNWQFIDSINEQSEKDIRTYYDTLWQWKKEGLNDSDIDRHIRIIERKYPLWGGEYAHLRWEIPSPKRSNNQQNNTIEKTGVTIPELGQSAILTPEILSKMLDNLVQETQAKKLTETEIESRLTTIAQNSDLHIITIRNIYQEKQQETLIKKIDFLINSGISGSELTIAFKRLGKEIGWNKKDVSDFYYQRIAELDRQASLKDAEAELKHLKDLKEARLNLFHVIPTKLAEAINRLADYMGVRSECCLTALICGLSSMHTSDSYLTISKQQNFYSPCNLWGAIVAEPGQMKSPIFNTFILSPLGHLQNKAFLEYQKQAKETEREQKRYDSLERAKEFERIDQEFPEGRPENETHPPVFFCDNATQAGLSEIFIANPHKIIAFLQDELSGLLDNWDSGNNKGNGGRANLLSYYDGKTSIEVRRDKIRYIEDAKLSVFGGIQPRPLSEMMFRADKEDGLWSRFLFVIQPRQRGTLQNDGGVEIGDLIRWLYEQFHARPSLQYTLTPEAFKLSQQRYDYLRYLATSEDRPAMAWFYNKCIGMMFRIAINLHCIEDAYRNRITTEISGDSITRAYEMVRFYIQQLELISYQQEDENKEQLSIPMSAILTKAQDIARNAQTDEEKWIDARTLKLKSSRALRALSTSEIRFMMQSLANLGYGQLKGTGTKMQFLAQL